MVERSRHLDAVSAGRYRPRSISSTAFLSKLAPTNSLALRASYSPSSCASDAWLDDSFLAPHSRYADFPAALIRDYTDLEILAETEEGDAYLFASKDKRIAFVTGHPEYDAQTLAQEYFRDVEAGLGPEVPYNYFPHNDPQNTRERAGVVTVICCLPTGSTITSIRSRHTIYGT